jgi:hypothetical protein
MKTMRSEAPNTLSEVRSKRAICRPLPVCIQLKEGYAGSPVARSALLREAASAGAQSTPEN